jgi:outer membrane protein TolC
MKTRIIAQIFNACLILILVALMAGVWAMDTQEITMDQAVKMALKNDSQVFNAGNNLEKAKLAVKQAVLKTWPQAAITDTYGDMLNDPIDHSDPRNAGLTFNQFPNMLTITITETIPSQFHLYGKKVPTAIETAIWDRIDSEAQLAITQSNVIYNTISYYFNALKLQQTIKYQESVVQSNQASLAIALEQLKQNKITKPDELKVENDLANATYTLEKNRSDYNLALRQLGNQIGMRDISSLKLVEPLNNNISDIPDVQQIKTDAVKRRLEMKQAEISILKAAQQLAQAQNQALPDLNLGYTYSNNDSNESVKLSYSFLSGDITGSAQKTSGDMSFIKVNNSSYGDRTYSILNQLTLKLTWNLDFGTPQNQIKQNQLLLDNAKSTGAQTKQGIEWDVEQAAAAYQLTIKKVEISRQAVPYYQKQLEIKQLQVKLGMASPPDLAGAQSNLLQAQNQLKSDEYDRLLAYKKLQMVSGELYPFQNQR